MIPSSVNKTIYLDSFVYASIAKEVDFADRVRATIRQDGLTLVVSTINLIEFLPNKKRLNAIIDFIASVPFGIPVNPDQLVDDEVRSYPDEISLSLPFISAHESYSEEELREAIQINLVSRIKPFRDTFVPSAGKTFEEIIHRRNSGKAAFTQSTEIELFLMSNLLAILYHSHPNFTAEHISTERPIELHKLKSYTIQILVIFEEYYQQNRPGRTSDISDILQLVYAPYVTQSVFDNAKVDTLRRIMKRSQSLPKIKCQTISEFRTTCSS